MNKDDFINITMGAIGIVRNQVVDPGEHDWKAMISEIEVEESLTPALKGIGDFSHIIVLYWMHQVSAEQRRLTQVHPRGKRELPLTGIFATRSPARPNPIGLRMVRLLEQRDNVLKVQGLDAFNGTPVLDIKPYLPEYDSAPKTRVPYWVRRVEASF